MTASKGLTTSPQILQQRLSQVITAATLVQVISKKVRAGKESRQIRHPVNLLKQSTMMWSKKQRRRWIFRTMDLRGNVKIFRKHLTIRLNQRQSLELQAIKLPLTEIMWQRTSQRMMNSKLATQQNLRTQAIKIAPSNNYYLMQIMILIG